MKSHAQPHNRYGFYKLLMLALLLCFSPLSFAQQVEIFTVQFRPAENIAEQIRALYPEKTVYITGRNQQLTVRAENQTLNEIRELVRSLDTPLRQFLISVSNDANANTSNQHWGVSGTISSSTGQISNSNRAFNSPNTSSTVKITTHNKTYQTRDGGSQSVTVLEGYSAYINAGQKKPIQSRQFINGQWANSIEYIDMTSGFYVEPRLVGVNRVELKISSQRNEASKQHHREIDTSTINTVQVIRMGEWVNIGARYSETSNSQSGISYSTKKRQVDKQSVMIKVDLLPH